MWNYKDHNHVKRILEKIEKILVGHNLILLNLIIYLKPHYDCDYGSHKICKSELVEIIHT